MGNVLGFPTQFRSTSTLDSGIPLAKKHINVPYPFGITTWQVNAAQPPSAVIGKGMVRITELRSKIYRRNVEAHLCVRPHGGTPSTTVS